MMGTCVVLFVLAFTVVRLWSLTAAIAMCVVAMLIPPVAAIVANRRGPDDHWWDEEEGQSGQRPGGPEPGAPDLTGHRTRTSGRHGRLGSSGDPESDAWWAELDDRSRKDRHE